MRRVTAITSKSYVHRLLIAAALCGEKITVVTNIVSDDMRATISALESLGAVTDTVSADDGSFELIVKHPVASVKNGCPAASIDCSESGSTARFILPLASYVAESATLTGRGRLPERPMGPLCDVLRRAGANIDADNLPLTVTGSILPGTYEIPGNVSSQYITGLMYVLPLLEGDSHLVIKGGLESAAYVDMTADVLSKFDIKMIKEESGYMIPGRQKYKPVSDDFSEGRIVAEGDWSNAAYVIAPFILDRECADEGIRIAGLYPASIQGDRAFIDILGGFGVEAYFDDATSEYVVRGYPLTCVDVDCSQIPDLVPILAVLAAFADGDSVFRNVERLRMKECDRIDAVSSVLSAIGVKTEVTKTDGHEDLSVHGGGVNAPVDDLILSSFNDHRIAMADQAIAAGLGRSLTIKGAGAVNKSYPGYFELMEKMGMKKCHLQ